MVDPAYRDQVFVNEARTEVKGSVAAFITLVAGTAFQVLEFHGRADPLRFSLWLGTMSLFLGVWLWGLVSYRRSPPSDATILRLLPVARFGLLVCNAATAGSVWVFMPVAGPELRALMMVMYAWFLIVQFIAATEATQVLAAGVVLVLGSLTAWLLTARPPYYLTFALFLPLFGAMLIVIRRFVRQAVVRATEAQAQADASRRELAAALVDLERERDAKTHFIRAASHDLQQPLMAATLFLDRVGTGGRAGDQADALGGVKRSLGLARTLVDTMLQYLKLESGLVKAQPVAFTAGELFDRLIVTQGPAAAAAQVRLSFAGRRTPLHTDPHLLARAVENLVTNALRHSGGRRVFVGARARADHAAIWVVDDGRGLGSGDAARIFRPFEQGATVGDAGGFGLGLASTLGLVELMSGTCGIQPGLTRGAAFYIRLPTRPAMDGSRCAA